ncbi:MAG: ribonuclease HI family protein [Elusimicrobia bacterium]|nr:ribonuclease HI family protein [Candidatus Obscuribacterium magneticum]
MDIKSYLKSATFEELSRWEELLADEIQRRKAKAHKIRQVKTYSDGASRGNPGPAGIGALLYDEADNKLVQDYRSIGTCTNNEAEYRALILALDHAADVTKGIVECTLDSELLVKQLNGEYALKSEKLKKFYDEVKHRVNKFDAVQFTHRPRTHPMLKLADKLANKAIDEAPVVREP